MRAAGAARRQRRQLFQVVRSLRAMMCRGQFAKAKRSARQLRTLLHAPPVRSVRSALRTSGCLVRARATRFTGCCRIVPNTYCVIGWDAIVSGHFLGRLWDASERLTLRETTSARKRSVAGHVRTVQKTTMDARDLNPTYPREDTCPKCGGSLSSDESEDACDCDFDDRCLKCQRVHCTDADDDFCAEMEHARLEVERGGSGDL